MLHLHSLQAPSEKEWELVIYIFQFFPIVTIIQWMGVSYPAGKTSIDSRLNIPGKIAWITMESPGFLTVLYCMATIPQHLKLDSLPRENIIMATLFVIHYIYRAIIGPLLNPSMSPIHIEVWLSAIVFQIMNGLSIGGYLGGYGPTTREEWISNTSLSWYQFRVRAGIFIWAFGFLGNIYHDDLLRDLRRVELRNRNTNVYPAESHPRKIRDGSKVEKLYKIPRKGLFSRILFPHYLCEWIEWAGWWMIGGSQCVPGKTFLINEISTMTPRAIQGRQWYLERFGREKFIGVKAIIPGIL